MLEENSWTKTNLLNLFLFAGYEGVSTDPGLAYRADTFPGLGFLLKRSFYDAHMKGNMKTCCGNR